MPVGLHGAHACIPFFLAVLTSPAAVAVSARSRGGGTGGTGQCPCICLHVARLGRLFVGWDASSWDVNA